MTPGYYMNDKPTWMNNKSLEFKGLLPWECKHTMTCVNSLIFDYLNPELSEPWTKSYFMLYIKRMVTAG